MDDWSACAGTSRTGGWSVGTTTFRPLVNVAVGMLELRLVAGTRVSFIRGHRVHQGGIRAHWRPNHCVLSIAGSHSHQGDGPRYGRRCRNFLAGGVGRREDVGRLGPRDAEHARQVRAALARIGRAHPGCESGNGLLGRGGVAGRRSRFLDRGPDGWRVLAPTARRPPVCVAYRQWRSNCWALDRWGGGVLRQPHMRGRAFVRSGDCLGVPPAGEGAVQGGGRAGSAEWAHGGQQVGVVLQPVRSGRSLGRY
mmetsp:Transcript_10531/g.26775  ORF Transcript_10531/g.26775 Transcript_10531/m.26775 type:complete len:252 (-) Transcript_10531:150-905(-)